MPAAEFLAQRLLLIIDEYRTEVVTQVQLDSPHAIVASEQSPPLSKPDAPWLMSANPNGLDFTELPDWEQLNSLGSVGKPIINHRNIVLIWGGKALGTDLVEFDMGILIPRLV